MVLKTPSLCVHQCLLEHPQPAAWLCRAPLVPTQCDVSVCSICCLVDFLTFSVLNSYKFLLLRSQIFLAVMPTFFCPSSNMRNTVMSYFFLILKYVKTAIRLLQFSLLTGFLQPFQQRCNFSSALGLLGPSFYTAFSLRWSFQNLFCRPQQTTPDTD